MAFKSDGGETLDFPHSNHERAPEDSRWAQEQGADFFLPPALPLEPLQYLPAREGQDPADAVREEFGFPEVPEPDETITN